MKKTANKYENVLTEKLIPYARNARTHSEQQVSQIAASIREFGFINPVIIDKDNGIIAGHGRVLAAQKLELSEVPCIRVEHLTTTQKKAYILADNKLALNAGWDNDLLKLEIEELKLEGFDLELTGFELPELDSLFGQFEITEGKERTGAKELDENEFSEFDNKCPKCGFEFDNK